MELTSWIRYKLERGSTKQSFKDKGIGLRVTVRARPSVEEFIKQLAGGRTTDATAYGEAWHSMDDSPLEVYIVDEPDQTTDYTLLGVGGSLIQYPAQPRSRGLSTLGSSDPTAPKPTINLGILRLVGISKPDGVTIGLQGMYSPEYMKILRAQLPIVTRQFLHDYIVPITLNLEIVSKDV